MFQIIAFEDDKRTDVLQRFANVWESRLQISSFGQPMKVRSDRESEWGSALSVLGTYEKGTWTNAKAQKIFRSEIRDSPTFFFKSFSADGGIESRKTGGGFD